MKRFVIVGLGVFGSGAAETLYREGHEVIAMDLNAEKVERLTRFVTRAVVGDAREREVLHRVGVQGADAAVVSTGDDISASALAVMALRDLDVQDIFVKVVSMDHARIMTRIGATRTVFPERESSVNLALQMIQGQALLNYIRIGSGVSIQEIAVPASWEGRTLRELNLTRQFRVSVVAINDVLSDTAHPVPDPDMPLLDTYTLILTGEESNLARVAQVK